MSEEQAGATIFKAGDSIVCLDAKPRGSETSDKLSKLAELQEGARYTVKEAYDWRIATGGWSLILSEIDAPFPYSWDSSRFGHAPEHPAHPHSHGEG